MTPLHSHQKPGLVLYKWYINLINSTLMIRNRYTVGKENIPAKGEKYFIACNHQNAANDAINIAFAYPVDVRGAVGADIGTPDHQARPQERERR